MIILIENYRIIMLNVYADKYLFILIKYIAFFLEKMQKTEK